MAFSTITLLCNHHQYLFSGLLPHPKQNLYPWSNNFTFPQPMVISIPASVFINLPILDTAYKCNPAIFVHLCLVYFTSHNALKVYLCCSIYQNLITFFIGLFPPFGYWEQWQLSAWLPAFNLLSISLGIVLVNFFFPGKKRINGVDIGLNIVHNGIISVGNISIFLQ